MFVLYQQEDFQGYLHVDEAEQQQVQDPHQDPHSLGYLQWMKKYYM